jgi:hypothetical protein
MGSMKPGMYEAVTQSRHPISSAPSSLTLVERGLETEQPRTVIRKSIFAMLIVPIFFKVMKKNDCYSIISVFLFAA